MDYSRIISDSLITKVELLSDYFISECKKAERDEFISPRMFFNSCNDFCKGLKQMIYVRCGDLMNKGIREVLDDGTERPLQIDLNDFSYPFSYQNRYLQVKIRDVEQLERMIEVAKIEYIDLPALISEQERVDKLIEKEEKKKPQDIKNKKHNLPTIDTNKYDPDLIYEKFNNVVFKCTKECFDARLVDGNEHPDNIEYCLLGRISRITGEKTLNIAQLRKFIEKITGNVENTKDAYYKKVFGLEIKTSQIKSATNLNETFRELKNCVKVKK